MGRKAAPSKTLSLPDGDKQFRHLNKNQWRAGNETVR
jgi:hypothetical protein